ncbi:MAG: zinc ABC transporter substrate-binding protein [Methylophilus sp.]|jgi:zinc/manganese transport system substrate-binding protein
MMKMMRTLLCLFCLFYASVAQAKISVLAAENIYGSIAQSIGGNAINVTSVLNNPNQDPHLFSVDPRTAAAFHQAQLIIINGAAYDPWAENLTQSTPATIINVAQLAHIANGSNPHIWYNFQVIEAFANHLADTLTQLDPKNKIRFTQNLKTFLTQLHELQHHTQQLKTKLSGKPITATEPVATYLTNALGLTMLNQGFQTSMMNDTEPSVHDRAAMIDSLKQHHVKILIINLQVSDPINQQLQQLANANKIAVVGVTELLPVNEHYLSWMTKNVNHISQPLMP